ncbi:MAG TPA: helix-turn-helix transcriptional regulator [Parachlamydiaceae bacterium]|nr:helix-turn-helix transcriptional regulator [Parachlamydiaceae bacterium]
MKKKSQTYEEKLADSRVEIGSGNVYADLGFDHPEEMLAKAQLVSEMQKSIKKKKITQTEAAEMLGLTQPKLSILLKGQFKGYSTDRLIRFLRILGQDIDIFVTPKLRNKQAHLHVYSSVAKPTFTIAAKSRLV